MSEGQNGFHGNKGCLATGPRILHIMIEYFKNANVCKPHAKTAQRSRSHRNI